MAKLYLLQSLNDELNDEFIILATADDGDPLVDVKGKLYYWDDEESEYGKLSENRNYQLADLGPDRNGVSFDHRVRDSFWNAHGSLVDAAERKGLNLPAYAMIGIGPGPLADQALLDKWRLADRQVENE